MNLRQSLLRTLLLAVVCVLSAASMRGQTRIDLQIRMDDGVTLEATTMQPAGIPPLGGYPGIVLVHGYGGNKDGMLPYSYLLTASGYTTIAYSVRGQGNSGGVSTTEASREVDDLRAVIQYLRTVKYVDPDRIGVTGGSQGGIHAWMAAAYRMPGIRAVAALIATPDFARALVPNGCVKTGLAMEMTLGSVRYSPDRDMVRDYIIQDMYDSVLAYIDRRDLGHLVQNIQVPVLQALGWADYLFPANGGIRAASHLSGTGVPVWSYYGTNGHGEPVNTTEATFQFETAVKWFDRWLKGRTLEQDSVPLVFYADDRPDWPRRTTTWPPDPTSLYRFYVASGALSGTPPQGDVSLPFSLSYDPSYTPRRGWDDTYRGSEFLRAFTARNVRLASSPLGNDIEVTGIPVVHMRTSSNATRYQAHVRLFDVAGESWTLVSRAPHGIRNSPAGGVEEQTVEANALSHLFPAGHRIGIEVTSLDMLRDDQANIVPFFQSTESSLLSSASSPSYLEIPVVGPQPVIAGVSRSGENPGALALEQNYPNPFNPATNIAFRLPAASRVRLSVYDILGHQVALLVDGLMPAGTHEVLFNGNSLPTGVYFSRLETPGFTATQKMILMK